MDQDKDKPEETVETAYAKFCQEVIDVEVLGVSNKKYKLADLFKLYELENEEYVSHYEDDEEDEENEYW